jgi:branched-chain amino acid transport system ATP-binding protein
VHTAEQRTRDVVLSIENLSAGYGNLQVLQDVSMSLREGDLAVVIGPNGSGKSTTVKSVFGLTTNFGGRIAFAGTDITSMQTHRIVKLGIGYVPQGRLVFDTLTVRENLAMGGYDVPAAELGSRMEEMLELFPLLREFLDRKASFLSGGQQQQLSIARALMRKPRLLLLDEPSLGLDPKTQSLIFRTVKEICARGVCVLMVEQNARQALAVCTHAYVVECGKVVASGGPELARHKRMQELYLGGM